MKKLLVTFSIIFFGISIFGQQKYTIISGKVLDSLGIVKNANIINLKTTQGTFSNDEGLFRIFVSVGDTLQVSSIQHYSKKVGINKTIFDNKNTDITLTAFTYVLDEFELKRHNLTGRLSIDTKSTPTDLRDSLLKKNLDFSKINLKIVEKDDYIDSRVRPQVVTVDPTARFVGAGVGASITFKNSEKLWALRKELDFKKTFPYKIMSSLGDTFFFDDLKIPLDNYFHFLEFCNPLGIEKMYQEGKLLEVIKILQTESITYLKLIKKE